MKKIVVIMREDEMRVPLFYKIENLSSPHWIQVSFSLVRYLTEYSTSSSPLTVGPSRSYLVPFSVSPVSFSFFLYLLGCKVTELLVLLTLYTTMGNEKIFSLTM